MSYYQKNRARLLQYQKNWVKKNYEKNLEYNRKYMKKYIRNLKLKIMAHYTHGKMECQCPKCDVKIIEFLSIDHINGGGNKQRKVIGTGTALYMWIIQNKFPKGFQILCYNCNMAKGFFGACPHGKL